MSHMFRLGMLVVLLVLAPMVLVHAAPAPAAAPVSGIGVVDLDAIAKGYVGSQKANDALSEFRKARKDVFDTMQKAQGLTPELFEEYKRLAGSPVKVNPERIRELEGLAKKNLDEYKALTDKGEGKLTAEEKTRFTALDTQLKETTATLNEMGDKLSNEVQDELARYSKVLYDLVDKAIASVAKEKKLSIVLNSSIQSQEGMERFVLWGGTDISNDVVAQLNNTFKPEMLVPPAHK